MGKLQLAEQKQPKWQQFRIGLYSICIISISRLYFHSSLNNKHITNRSDRLSIIRDLVIGPSFMAKNTFLGHCRCEKTPKDQNKLQKAKTDS